MKINELYLENHQENSNFKVGKKAPPPPCFTNYNLTTFSMSEFGRKKGFFKETVKEKLKGVKAET